MPLAVDRDGSSGTARELRCRTELAGNYAALFEDLANTSNLIQPVPGQRDRIPNDQKMWEIKKEAKESLEQFFTENAVGHN